MRLSMPPSFLLVDQKENFPYYLRPLPYYLSIVKERKKKETKEKGLKKSINFEKTVFPLIIIYSLFMYLFTVKY